MQATIFDYLDSILNHKRRIGDIEYEENQYNNFMCNRWLSMHSDVVAEVINDTTNKYWSQMTSSTEHYDFVRNLLPKYSKRKINYIKKIKKIKEEKSDAVDHTANIAKRVELSTREIKQYMS
jgi:hypothetical protein